LQGEFLPRQRLVEAELTDRFGGSRFIVRGALQTLASEGLVEMEKNRGAWVRAISTDEAIEITELRLVVEGFVAARAAERATEADVTELRQLVASMREALAEGELVRYSAGNATLHGAFRRIADHRIATELVERLRGQMVRHQVTLALVPGRPAVSIVEHEAIVTAIAAGDPVGAEAAMRVHVASVIEALRSTGDAGKTTPRA